MTCTIEELKNDFRMNYKSDEWGNTLSWLFNICDILMFERGTYPPAEWEYKPSIMGSSIDDDWGVELLRDADTNTLIKFGWLLHKLSNLLKRCGMDY